MCEILGRQNGTVYLYGLQDGGRARGEKMVSCAPGRHKWDKKVSEFDRRSTISPSSISPQKEVPGNGEETK